MQSKLRHLDLELEFERFPRVLFSVRQEKDSDRILNFWKRCGFQAVVNGSI